MSRLIETICIIDGAALNLQLHNARMNAARRGLFGREDRLDLAGIIAVPSEYAYGRMKCRVVYEDVVVSVDFFPYVPRVVRSLQLVVCDDIDYAYKYEDRSVFERLSAGRVPDEILIVKKGLITDTSYSNIVFTDGTKWVTPASPLLRGVKRQSLLDEGKIIEEEVRPVDLQLFTEAHLINAMLDLGEIVVCCEDIV